MHIRQTVAELRYRRSVMASGDASVSVAVMPAEPGGIRRPAACARTHAAATRRVAVSLAIDA